MFVDVQTETLIQRPLEEVATFSADPENAPRWYANIKSVEWRSQPGVRVGARVAFVAHFLGRRMAYTYEIVEYEPEARLVMRTAEGPFPMETSYSWEAAAQGTLMRLRNRGEPSGFKGLMAPLMQSAMRRANLKDLALLKQLLESSG
ncbi:MAG: SRPBCC family protein [Polyangiaceae bacterium]